MVENKKALFCVRCVFKHARRQDMKKRNLFEERLTIWKAKDIDDAIALAEKDADKYAEECDCEYLDFAQAFEIFENRFKNGLEVYSLMRESNLADGKYIEKFFNTGNERQRKE